MYHERFSGTHYEIGFRWGALLAKHGKFLLDNLGFPITQERLDFAAACAPIYEKHFPEILEEIRGLAEGQGCEPEMLQAFLFSMYAMPPQPHCSCFAVSNGQQILFGRNSDFLTALEKYTMNVTYRFSSGSCAFTGNTTAFLQMEDGVNEYGLALGLTSLYPPAKKPGLNAGMLLRYCLEKCTSTREVIARIQTLPISSAQTFTVADASGDIAVLESYSEAVEVIRPTEAAPYVCATNSFQAFSLRHLNRPELNNWYAELRYRTLSEALPCIYAAMTLDDAAGLLAGRHGFLCQYDRRTGKDTVWSVIYDLKNKRIFRAEGNPSQCIFKEDKRFSI